MEIRCRASPGRRANQTDGDMMKKLYVFYLCLIAHARGWLTECGYRAMTIPKRHTGLVITWHGFNAALSMYTNTGNKIWAIRRRSALYVHPMSAEDV